MVPNVFAAATIQMEHKNHLVCASVKFDGSGLSSCLPMQTICNQRQKSAHTLRDLNHGYSSLLFLRMYRNGYNLQIKRRLACLRF